SEKLEFFRQIALYLSGVSGQDKVSQSPLSVSVGEKEQVLISCSTTEQGQGLQWYRQYPNQALKHLVTGQTGEQQKDNLSITGTEVTDAATYLCAVETQ
uniref:Ig-like domain-containing protein n=1 Tax=Callorhinchus milii TaxID=7868 RepID=A0A4W3GAE7_CALMI